MEFKYLTNLSQEELEKNVIIPCNYEDYNCILIKNKYPKDFVYIQKTDNLEIRLNTVVTKEDEKFFVHIIKSTKNDLLYNQQFLIIYNYIFSKIERPIDDNELKELINSIEDYFRVTKEKDNEKFQIGVFGELLAIKNLYENGYEEIIDKYHNNFYSKHDIEINKNTRIEIKTTGKHNRIHSFSHDQIVRTDIDVFVLSIKLEQYEKGTIKKEVKVQESLPLFYEDKKSKVEEMLDNIDILKITPMDAMNLLYKLKEENKK